MKRFNYNGIYGKENVLEIGYADLQHITPYLRQIGYTCGVYGWNATIYEVTGYNLAICTGYRPFGTSNLNAWKLCKRWDNLFSKYDYKQKKRMIKRFCNAFANAMNV